MGTDDYMTKPVDEEEMLLRIHALLRRAKIANEKKITIGDVVLDYDSMAVTGHGQVQELPPKRISPFIQAFILSGTDLYPDPAHG